jgi:hypothetical protein
MGLNKGNRLVCGYTTARLVDEIEKAATRLEMEWGVAVAKSKNLPAANALLRALPHTCPGVDESVVERVGDFLKYAEELFDKGEYKHAAGWLTTAKASILDLFWKD